MNRQELVLVVCRTNIDSATLEPLQLMMPTMQMAAPFALYTTIGQRITGPNLYNSLVKLLAEPGEVSLSQTLRTILHTRKDKPSPFRVCIIGGEEVNWDIVLEYKRHKILIDTAGAHQTLSQVSHTTGGISKTISPGNIIRTFLSHFSKPTSIRKYFFLQKQLKVEYHLQHLCEHTKTLSSSFYACSVCMSTYCEKCKKEMESCRKCSYQFDPDLEPKEPQYEIPLLPESTDKTDKQARKATEERVQIN